MERSPSAVLLARELEGSTERQEGEGEEMELWAEVAESAWLCFLLLVS